MSTYFDKCPILLDILIAVGFRWGDRGLVGPGLTPPQVIPNSK